MRLPILLLSILGLSLGFGHDSPSSPAANQYATELADRFFTKFIKAVKYSDVRVMDSLLLSSNENLSSKNMIREFYKYPNTKIHDARFVGRNIATTVFFPLSPHGYDIPFKSADFILKKRFMGDWAITSMENLKYNSGKG
ncbi:DUF4440 domain-containing protein [Caenorhabditis elegans]|uniref:DUF4440 domain-containing protein n=1 Tax=Caenorhabditis elegans TaxID=6239 RepID=P91048_CAEEL|nr:DUF4440 domain-containing protein [Caenorhabditis elegans]CCD64698.1 DUF4440 domain-containing protein [Caenorhabditis elegans]|eukprot:NP_494552.1 Uncharacterized protein CELE_C16C8.8 [Caenorhabditis elegans]